MPCRVLLVDDEPNLRETLALILEHHGFEVSTAGGVEEARRRMAEAPFDVLLTDLSMPPEGTGAGYGAARAMRERQPGAAVVVLSGYLEAEPPGEEEAGLVDEYLAKPVEIPVLLGKLAARCRRG